MPLIQSRRKNKNHYQVTIAFPDGHVEEVKVSEDLIVEFRVSEGKSFDDSAFASFRLGMRRDEALQKALKALKRQEKSAKELREILAKEPLSAADRHSVFEKLRRLGYVDDERLAKSYVDYHSEVLLSGPKKIAYELGRRGIDSALVEDALRAVDPSRWEGQLTRLYRKYEAAWKKKPTAAAILAIKSKCFELGYPDDVVKRFMASNAPALESQRDDGELLNQAILKAKRQLDGTSSDARKLKQKIIERLLRKGFRYEAIIKQLSGGSWDESEDFGF